MTLKLLTEHHLEFLSLKGSCTGVSESTLVKMPHCWKSFAAAHLSNGPETLYTKVPVKGFLSIQRTNEWVSFLI